MIALGLAILAPASSARAATFHVDAATGSDANSGAAGQPFATIQRAVDEADESVTPGADQIMVAAGTYVELITIEDDDPLVIQGNGGVTLQGDPSATLSAYHDTLTVTDTELTLERISIDDDLGWTYDAIDHSGGSLTLAQVDVVDARFSLMLEDLDALTISNSSFSGAYQSALHARMVTDVTVSNSTFSDNGWYGLDLRGVTTVDLTQVTASNDGDSGVVIGTQDGVKAQSVSISGGTFSDNDIHGLIVTADAIDIIDTTASGNEVVGLQLTGADTVDLMNITASGNMASFITSSTLVDIQNMTANDNQLFGLNVSATTTTITSLATHDNGLDGFLLDDGDLDLSNFQASGNAGNGLEVSSAGDVTLSALVCQDNGDDGVAITSSGDIEMQSVTAQLNTDDGIFIDDSGTVDLLWVNAFSNGDDGLEVLGSGAVTPSGSNFGNNGGDDVSIVP